MKILPPGVSFQKEIRDKNHIYTFHHYKLGLLGRIVVQSLPGINSNIACEVSGDTEDPMTLQRMQILKPITEKIIAEMQKQLNPANKNISFDIPPTPRDPAELIRSQGNPCDICGELTSILRVPLHKRTKLTIEIIDIT